MYDVVEVLKARNDPVYFAESKYFLGLKLWPRQREILREFYDEKKKYNRLILIAGMRSGKTFLSSVIALYELFKLLALSNPQEVYGLAHGSPIAILLVAKKEEQAIDTVLAQIKPKLVASPFFNEFEYKVRSLSIEFPEKYIKVLASTSALASNVGRTLKAFVLDEVSRFEETEKINGVNIFNTLAKSTATFGFEGKSIAISSPVHPQDAIMQLYAQAEGSKHTMRMIIPTWELNPNLPFDCEELQEARRIDPLSFWRDFGCKPFASQYAFFSKPEVVKEVMVGDNVLLKIEECKDFEKEYIVAIDPSLKNDAFGVSIGHLERNGKIIIDGSYRFQPESGFISPSEVEEFFLRLCKRFNITTLILDLWHFPHLLEKMKEKGVNIEFHRVNADDYNKLREMIFEKKIVLPNYQVLFRELIELQVKMNGKVDHPRKGSKDVADTVANIVQFLDKFRKPFLPFMVESFT